MPDGAADLVADLYRRMPEARITDILLEVDDATRFTETFTHMRTGEPCHDRIGLLNVLLAEGINLGLRYRWPPFWGTGRTASSNGQFFPAAGRGEALNLVNVRYGAEPGVKAYSHVSDRVLPGHRPRSALHPRRAPE